MYFPFTFWVFSGTNNKKVKEKSNNEKAKRDSLVSVFLSPLIPFVKETIIGSADNNCVGNIENTDSFV